MLRLMQQYQKDFIGQMPNQYVTQLSKKTFNVRYIPHITVSLKMISQKCLATSSGSLAFHPRMNKIH